MRRLALAAVLVAVACGRSSEPPRTTAPTTAAPTAGAVAAHGRVIDAEFASAALGVSKHYRAWLPADYDAAPARRYPVIYMLHGLGGNQGDWIGAGHLDTAADALGLAAIVIMPDGDAGFYADWATAFDAAGCRGNPFAPDERAADYCVTHAAYEAYVVRDLIAHVDATYRTLARKDARGIGGLSMGGFGALQLAMRHPELFAAAASHSGVDALLYVGPHPYVAGKVVTVTEAGSWGKNIGALGDFIRGIFGPKLADWQAHDPVTLARALQPGTLALYLDAGTEDGLALHDGAQYLHDVLTERGIAHAWYLGPGRHDFDFWSQRIDDSLAFFAKALTPAQ